MNVELSEFDVGTFAVLPDPSNFDFVKTKNLDGETLSFSKLRY